MKNTGEILQKIYDSEINIRIDWMWDGGLNYSISNDIWDSNDKIVHTGEFNIKKAIVIMAQDVVRQYPKSEFAKWVKLPKMVDTKQTKQTIQNKDEFPYLCDKGFIEAFNDYLDMRKNKATQNAIELRLKDLHKYDIKTAIAMIENSIMNGYQGIFKLDSRQTTQQSKLQQSLKRISEFEGKDEE